MNLQYRPNRTEVTTHFYFETSGTLTFVLMCCMGHVKCGAWVASCLPQEAGTTIRAR